MTINKATDVVLLYMLIGKTFYPLIQHELNFSKYLTNGTWTFPSESVHVQWVTSISSRYTSTLPVFGSRARGFDWNLVGSVGQILLLQKKTCVLNTFEETLSESEQNH